MCGIFAVISDNQKDLKGPTNKLHHRGPDDYSVSRLGKCYMEFWRLAINGTTEFSGTQPMFYRNSVMVCNGEVYNHLELGNTEGQSDCEIIQPMIELEGISRAVELINGDFAFVWSDGDRFYAARDRVGVRPLFFVHLDSGMAFASEAKALLHFKKPINHFPPGHIYDSELDEFICYAKMYYPKPPRYINDRADVMENIHNKLVEAVKLRFETTERPVGFFLSGGLDSSIIAAIGASLSDDPIHTFSIGFEGSDSPDLIAARKVAEHIGSIHKEVTFTLKEGLEAIKDVIWHLETYDVTTIRASVPMYLLSKYISENTDIKVILSGEGSDELFGGYLYFHSAPSVDAFAKESNRLLRDVNLFDVLRADRCTAAHGLELRVPFFDPDFIEYVMDGFSPEIKADHEQIEKAILRHSFVEYLPEEILMRQKNGMSDAVGYNWVNGIKNYAKGDFIYNLTRDPEETMYKSIFHGHGYPDDLYLYKWMPRWTNSTDPSARYLNEFNDKPRDDDENLFTFKQKCIGGAYLAAMLIAGYFLTQVA